jgi:hypothetical protein
MEDKRRRKKYIINDFCLLFYLLLTFGENISRGSGEVYCCTENAIIYEELMHCKAGPHRIGIHNTSKGINRYFLRI